ncbi:DUF1302 family protein [Pseudoduganella sp. FT93W]|uniref:DUF1302 family protein n=1 Tax=Duganella fentianensis TaxID=2692177 RepID=A0A845HUS0_9BURK|nr:DUF1302 domain-containing protein [Duganella fentianensis]MYN44769.1 DUF1302 family protein [Duganella fentianensis]
MKLLVKTNTLPARRIAVSAVLAVLSAGTAYGAEWTMQNGWVVNLDSTISFGMIARTSSADCRNLGNDNGGCVGDAATPLQLSNPAVFAVNLDTLRLNQDLGNLRYGKGQVVSANLQYSAELYVKASDGWSGLLRGVANHDFAVDRSTRAPLDSAARDFAVSNPRWLDAYVTKEFDFGAQQARVRVGNQVLSWGEDLFIAGGVNSINALYVPTAHQPGTPLKNLFIPAPMLSFSSSLAEGWGVEAFYQWKWNRYTFDAPGTFFSTTNFAGNGGRGIYLPTSALNAAVARFGLEPFPAGTIGNPATLNIGINPQTGLPYGRRLSAAELADPAVNPAGAILGSGTVIPRVGEHAPHNGQGGIAVRHRFAESGDEMGLYYIRYDDKVPFVKYRVSGTSANPFGLEAALDYGTHRDLFGISYNLQAGEWVIGSELSFRPRDGVTIDPTAVIDPRNKHYCNALADFSAAPLGSECRGWVDTQHYQLHLTGIHILSPSGMLGGLLRASGASEGTISAETALAYYPKLRLNGTVPYAVSADYSLPTKTSWGMVFAASLTYPNVFGTRASLTPDLAVSQGLSGLSATAQPGFIKGAGAAVLGMTVDLKVKPETKLRLDYTKNWGGGAVNPMRDRNFVSFSMASSF